MTAKTSEELFAKAESFLIANAPTSLLWRVDGDVDNDQEQGLIYFVAESPEVRITRLTSDTYRLTYHRPELD